MAENPKEYTEGILEWILKIIVCTIFKLTAYGIPRGVAETALDDIVNEDLKAITAWLSKQISEGILKKMQKNNKQITEAVFGISKFVYKSIIIIISKAITIKFRRNKSGQKHMWFVHLRLISKQDLNDTIKCLYENSLYHVFSPNIYM